MGESNKVGYKTMCKWVLDQLSLRHNIRDISVEQTVDLVEIKMLAEIYNKKVLNVASDIKRMAIKENERLQ